MLKVVIADDEQHISKLLNSLIDWNALGYEIVGNARDGYSALRLCDEKKPDILITDIRMPGLGGMELIHELHRLHPEIKVIIITGYSQFEYAHQALRFGVVDYLLKPIKKEELLRALEAGREQKDISMTKPNTDGSSDVKLMSMQSIKGNLLLDILRDREMLRRFSRKDRIPEEYHLQFRGNSWQMLRIEVVLNSEEDSLSVQAYLEKKLREILKEEFRNENIELIIAAHEGSIYCLLNGSAEALETIKDHLQPVKNSLLVVNELFKKIIFTIGVSNVSSSFDGIDRCLDECAEAVSYKIIAGKNRVIRKSDIPENKYDADFFTDAEFRKDYLYAIAEVDEDALRASFSALTSAIYEKIDYLDGNIVREIYRIVVTLFFTGAQVHGILEDGINAGSLMERFGYFYSITAAFNYLSDTFLNLLGEYREEQDNRSTRPVKVAQLYIEEHYMEPLTLEEIAKEIGLNESYLSSIFKKQVGKSLIDYLTHVRIQHAKELLIDPERSIEDISDEVGFSDPKYFTRRFKKYTGVSPRAYRNLFA